MGWRYSAEKAAHSARRQISLYQAFSVQQGHKHNAHLYSRRRYITELEYYYYISEWSKIGYYLAKVRVILDAFRDVSRRKVSLSINMYLERRKQKNSVPDQIISTNYRNVGKNSKSL